MQLLNKYFKIIFIWIIPVACSNGDFSFNDNLPKYKVDHGVFKLIKEGDILLRQGLGPLSTHIVDFMNEKNKLSHCGIVCKINNQLKVVHCISEELSGINGVQTQSINEFFSDVADSNVAIVRPKLDSLEKTKFVKEANRFLNKKIKFDNYFDFKDTSTMYCSEMVYYSYRNCTSKNPFEFKETKHVSLMKFDSFFKQKYFTTIWKAKK